MSTATTVPVTRTMDGDQLSADDAWTTLRRHGRRALLADAFVRFRYADGFSHARALGLQICLAFLPFTIAVVGLAGTLHQQRLGHVIEHTLTKLTPGASEGLFDAALRNRHEGVGGQLALFLGLVAGVVSLATAMGQIERGANRIYGIERDRPGRAKYLQAFLMAVTVGLLAMVGFLLIVAGSATGNSLAATYHWSASTLTAWNFARWPTGLMLALASVTVIFARSPHRRQPGGTWLAIGSAVSLLLWLALTGLLALYVAKSSLFGSTYGPLTGVIALLVWANLSAVALFLGLSFSAQLEAVRAGVPEPATPPVRRRGRRRLDGKAIGYDAEGSLDRARHGRHNSRARLRNMATSGGRRV